MISKALKPIGIILAGGQAHRLHGADKALIALGGTPLLAHCIARLAPQCHDLVVSANGDPARYASYDISIVADEDELNREGPLAGILAVLDEIARRDLSDRAVTTPVDTPFLPHDLVARLDGARRTSGASIAVATSGGRRHHAVALWPVAIRHAMRAAFAAGERSVGRFADRHGLITVDWNTQPIDPFFNVNTPADLTTAETFILPSVVSGR